MVQINFARKEVNCKIVYYGPGMSGKTTNLEKIFENAPDENKGDLTSIATEGDRTLFFDFLPLDLGQVAGMNTKFPPKSVSPVIASGLPEAPPTPKWPKSASGPLATPPFSCRAKTCVARPPPQRGT